MLSEETRSTNSSDRRSGRIRKQTQLFDSNQYARSAASPRSQIGPIRLKSTKSAFKNVVQTVKQEWKNRLSGTPGLARQARTVSRERKRTGSTKSVQNRQGTGRTGDGTSSVYDAEAERIWRDTETEEDDN